MLSVFSPLDGTRSHTPDLEGKTGLFLWTCEHQTPKSQTQVRCSPRNPLMWVQQLSRSSFKMQMSSLEWIFPWHCPPKKFWWNSFHFCTLLHKRLRRGFCVLRSSRLFYYLWQMCSQTFPSSWSNSFFKDDSSSRLPSCLSPSLSSSPISPCLSWSPFFSLWIRMIQLNTLIFIFILYLLSIFQSSPPFLLLLITLLSSEDCHWNTLSSSVRVWWFYEEHCVTLLCPCFSMF